MGSCSSSDAGTRFWLNEFKGSVQWHAWSSTSQKVLENSRISWVRLDLSCCQWPSKLPLNQIKTLKYVCYSYCCILNTKFRNKLWMNLSRFSKCADVCCLVFTASVMLNSCVANYVGVGSGKWLRGFSKSPGKGCWLFCFCESGHTVELWQMVLSRFLNVM